MLRAGLRRRSEGEKGQASAMIAMLMLTFLIFFAFVIHTGTLVSAKINLQNAADLAAYAGAATQARQLTHISYLNYEMRRQYKKFLFRYYVLGNMAQGTHPRTPVAGRRNWKPSDSVALSMNVPVVCLIFNATDNYCTVGTLSKLSSPRPSPLDSISATLFGQFQRLESIRQNNCGTIGNNNLQVLMLWLYNTDPTLADLPSRFSDPEILRNIGTIRGLTQGLGLVPRELLLRKRIDTLAEYINQPAEEGLTIARVANLQSAVDSHARERSIQSFLSAYHTLGNHTFDEESIVMTEILPNTEGGAKNLLKLNDIRVDFDAFAQAFVLGPNSGPPPPPGTTGTVEFKDCLVRLLPVSVRNLPVGVYKDPKVMTYYAVRLKAKAKTMFSPFGEMELKAYAAARPFGSRIGPAVETPQGEFSQPAAGPPMDLLGVFDSTLLTRFQPNLALFNGESAAPGQGWENKLVIGGMYRSLFPQNFDPTAAGNFMSIGLNEISRALPTAMAPNPNEGSRYSIPNDLGDDPYTRNFDTNGLLAFWAPIVPPNQVGQLNNYLMESLGELLREPPGNPIRPSSPEYKRILSEQLIRYATQLTTGGGEDGETLNVVKITDPFNTRPIGNQPASPIAQPVPQPKLLERDLAAIKTSWVTEVDRNFTAQKRTGYSVKFVPFETLTRNPPTTNGTQKPNNSPRLDPESEGDINSLRH